MLSGIAVQLNYSVLVLAQNGMPEKSAAFAMFVIGAAKTGTLLLPIFFLAGAVWPPAIAVDQPNHYGVSLCFHCLWGLR
jgi:hypothetical protein